MLQDGISTEYLSRICGTSSEYLKVYLDKLYPNMLFSRMNGG